MAKRHFGLLALAHPKIWHGVPCVHKCVIGHYLGLPGLVRLVSTFRSIWAVS